MEGFGASKRLLVLAYIVLAFAVAGCGAHTTTRTVTVTQDAFAVKKGMTKQQVQRLAGDPLVGSPTPAGRDCWFYAPNKKGITIHAIRFCFANGRVSQIQAVMPGSSD